MSISTAVEVVIAEETTERREMLALDLKPMTPDVPLDPIPSKYLMEGAADTAVRLRALDLKDGRRS